MPQPENDARCISARRPAGAFRLGDAAEQAVAAFEVRTRQGRLPPSSASAYVPSSSHQNASSNRVPQRSARARQLTARSVDRRARRQPGGAAPRRIRVALHFAEGDRRSASVPSAWKTESYESFQPCCTSPLALRRAYSRKPSPSAIAVAVHPLSAASMCGQSSIDERRGRRCARSRRRRASRTAALHRRCRSSGRTGPRRAPPSRRSRISCRILPGSASAPRRRVGRLRRGEKRQHAARDVGRGHSSSAR